ncbi:hypothetical protein OJAV_G00006870 [Oryzias javanicus]|uniref:Choline transporter-like protein n=1 Tax=Oryzias javanicus TaxID=123683 RepID=A0A437DMK2_ORYJA|nr:hypothetical protein OJAV_G00006870 [Oryzias javanicus]
MGCCSSSESKSDWLVNGKELPKDRRCTDIPWLIIFMLFCLGMIFICGFAVATGGASRLLSGYDSYGSDLCTYDITPTRYESHGDRFTKCPKLPVQPSKAVPVFRRCIPADIGCYAEFAQGFITFVSDNTVLRRVLAGVVTSKEVIMGLCVLALVLSLIMMAVIRYITKLLVYILTCLVILGSTGGVAVLWWLYADHKKALDTNSTSAIGKEVTSDNVKALLVYAIIATVFTVILLLVIFFMRKRVALTISLFHVAGKVFIHLPFLVLQPLLTFLSLMLFWVYWIAVLLFLGTSGTPMKNNSTELVEYRMEGPLQYTVWYHAVGLIWISEFILAFQQMTTALVVANYYFTKDKSTMVSTPILSAMMQTIRYHLGTIAKGSFIITLVKIPRLILTYIHSQLKGKENACARCMLKACVCCLWCLEKCLAYLNQNAYAATAIKSTNFCTSACEAFVILVENALRVAAINTVGDFVLFMGKILIVATTAFAGILALNYQREYTVWNVVDVLFLCFAIDCKYRDGSPGKEYFMDKSLMEFVENNRKTGLLKEEKGDEKEMKPMTRGGTSA